MSASVKQEEKTTQIQTKLTLNHPGAQRIQHLLEAGKIRPEHTPRQIKTLFGFDEFTDRSYRKILLVIRRLNGQCLKRDNQTFSHNIEDDEDYEDDKEATDNSMATPFGGKKGKRSSEQNLNNVEESPPKVARLLPDRMGVSSFGIGTTNQEATSLTHDFPVGVKVGGRFMSDLVRWMPIFVWSEWQSLSLSQYVAHTILIPSGVNKVKLTTVKGGNAFSISVTWPSIMFSVEEMHKFFVAKPGELAPVDLQQRHVGFNKTFKDLGLEPGKAPESVAVIHLPFCVEDKAVYQTKKASRDGSKFVYIVHKAAEQVSYTKDDSSSDEFELVD